MNFKLVYLRTWLIIKRKQILNLFPSSSKSFTKFAIVCAPRSGSTWLHTLLNSHSQIISYGETLREHYKDNPGKQLASLDELVFHPHHASIQAVGLKLFYEYENDEVYQQSFNEVIADKSICIIHLIREDKIAQFKSLKRAEASQVWSSGKRKDKQQDIIIDPLELEAYKNNLIQKEHQIDTLFQHHPVLKIKYEDLCADNKKMCAKIQTFINVTPKNLFSLLKRQSG